MATPAGVVAAAVDLVRDWQDEAGARVPGHPGGDRPPTDAIEVT